jgi:hypothetical protein
VDHRRGDIFRGQSGVVGQESAMNCWTSGAFGALLISVPRVMLGSTTVTRRPLSAIS